jgi:hypothetical protein
LLNFERESLLSEATVNLYLYCFPPSGVDLCIQFRNLTA